MLFAESPRRQLVSQLLSWGHWFCLSNIIIALIIATVYIFATPLPDTLLGYLYLFLNWLGHISFLTFLTFVVCVLPACYFIKNSATVRAIGAIVAALALALLAFDALLFYRSGLHLSFSEKTRLVNETSAQLNQLGWQQGVFFIVIFISWTCLQLVLANGIWQRLERLSKMRISSSLIVVIVSAFISSHFIHIWADANLYRPIIKQDSMFPVSYPATAKTILARYDMLDLADYRQQQKLQFSQETQNINYPLAPLYCPIKQEKLLIIVADTPLKHVPDTSFSAVYLNNIINLEQRIDSMLYGLPWPYTHSLTQTPVLLALLQGFQVPIHLHFEQTRLPAHAQPFNKTLISWQQSLLSDNSGLFMAKLNHLQSEQLLAELSDVDFPWLILNSSEDALLGQAISNQKISSSVVLNEDMSPSVLQHFGCNSPQGDYTTGQNIWYASRDWSISAIPGKLYLIDQSKLAIVQENGASTVLDTSNGQLINETLNTKLFNRAVKHLTSFQTRQQP